MNKYEMYDFIEGTREAIYMVIDEHGVLCEDGHWLTEEELYAMSDNEVLAMYDLVYGKV